MIRAYADRIVVIQDGNVIGEHRRQFGRDEIIYDAWRYIEILKHKPSALRNGAPFKEWALLWEEANRKHFVLKGAL